MRDIRLIFYEITGMITSLYFPAWKSQVDMLPRNAKCRFCHIIQSTPGGRELCSSSDARIMETLKTKKKPFVHHCHTAGLTGIAMPVFFRGTFLGTVFTGDALTHRHSKTHFERITRKLKGLDIDLAELEKAYYEIPVLSPPAIDMAVRLLTHIADSIVDKEQIIHLQTILAARQQETTHAMEMQTAMEKDPQGEITGLEEYLPVKGSADRDISMEKKGETSRQQQIVREALAFIENYYCEQIRLDDVAAHVSTSPNYLSAIFHRECGCTFAAYLARKRVSRACQLLADHKINIGEIGIQVGYYNPSYFNQIFKKLTGVSPGSYRKRFSSP